MKNLSNKKNNRLMKLSGILSMFIAASLTAGTAIETNVPLFGYIAPSVFSQTDLSDGDALIFVPGLVPFKRSGNLYAAAVSTGGQSNLDNPIWNAASLLDNRDWDDRYIVTLHKDTGLPVPFRGDTVHKDQRDSFGDKALEMQYIRGDRDNEDTDFRSRFSVFGDIAHSNLVHVAKPKSKYTTDPTYTDFVTANANREGRLYVGANDGMLHAFNATNGEETFAYIPATVIPKMKEISQPDHEADNIHNQYVDGPVTVGDAKIGGAWKSVLVSGLGNGGKALFALDVTSADPITSEDNSLSGAGSKFMWEVSNKTTDPNKDFEENLGFTHAGASVVQLNNGDWAVVVGNGYGSKNKDAYLFILNVSDGSIITTIPIPNSYNNYQDDRNGLSTPAVFDKNSDGKIDYAYAGDLHGNMWKFDLSSSNVADWGVAYNDTPLYSPDDSDTNSDGSDFFRQAITTAPSIGLHPVAGYFIYFGTGRLLSEYDQGDKSQHEVVGIWDKETWSSESVTDPDTSLTVPSDLPIRKRDLLEQYLTEYKHNSGREIRIATDNQPDWATHKGWITSLEPTNVNTERKGERILQKITFLNGRIQFVSNNPTLPDNKGENWWMQLDAKTGGSPNRLVIDVNDDGALTASDAITLSFTGPSGPYTQTVYPMGLYQGGGLWAQPSFAVVDNELIAANINRIVFPIFVEPPPGGENPPVGTEDFGLIGGHMDLDVASQTYPINDADTDEHTHEWDDKYGNVVNYMDIPSNHRSVSEVDGDPDPSLPGSDPDQLFIITIANAHLSPGGWMEINNERINVVNYRARIKRWLNNSLLPSEKFFRYKLGPVSAAEYAADIRQLTHFQMEVDRDALQKGGLIGTNTGCIKGNDESPGGEYRNGSLTTQLLDATHMDPSSSNLGYVEDALGNWTANDGTANAPGIHKLGYATPSDGTHDIGDGMLWEATLFWHWGGGCYTPDLLKYADDFASEIPGGVFVQQFDANITTDTGADGSTTIVNPDGSTTTTSSDGTITDVAADGTTTITYTDGATAVITTAANGDTTTVATSASGNTVTTVIVYHTGNSTETTVHDTGYSIITTVTETDSAGNETVTETTSVYGEIPDDADTVTDEPVAGDSGPITDGTLDQTGDEQACQEEGGCQDLENLITPGSNDVGRLFWREFVPDQ